MKNIRDLFEEFTPGGEQLARMEDQIEEKLSVRRFCSLRKAATVFAVGILLGVLTFSAAALANPSLGEAVLRIFTREEKLIDTHAVQIGAAEEEETASLCVEKAVRDGNTTYLYCRIARSDGMMEGEFLLAEHIRVMQTVEEINSRGDSVRRTHSVMDRPMGLEGILAGDILKVLSDPPAESVRLILPLQLGEHTEGEYSLTLTEPFTAVSLPDGTFARTVIADELSVSFVLSDIIEELDVYEVFPMTEFPLGGGTVRLKSVRITPLEVRVTMDDPTGIPVPVPGHPELEVSVVEFLRGFVSLHEWEDEGWTKLHSREEYTALNRAYSWDIELVLRDGVSEIDMANSYGRWSGAEDRSVVEYFRLTSPIYPEDVRKITLRCYGSGEEMEIWPGNKAEDSSSASELLDIRD